MHPRRTTAHPRHPAREIFAAIDIPAAELRHRRRRRIPAPRPGERCPAGVRIRVTSGTIAATQDRRPRRTAALQSHAKTAARIEGARRGALRLPGERRPAAKRQRRPGVRSGSSGPHSSPLKSERRPAPHREPGLSGQAPALANNAIAYAALRCPGSLEERRP